MRRIATRDGLVLLDTSSSTLYAFSESARDAWELIGTGRSERQMIRDFASIWRIPVHVAEPDLRSILARWREYGLTGEPQETVSAEAAPEASTGGHPQPRWTWEGICTIGDRVIGFASEGDLSAGIHAMFRHLATPGARPEVRMEVRSASARLALLVDGRERIRTADAALLSGALWQAVLEALHPSIEWLALIHGGAVARDGRAVGICGPSGSGKSTLIASLAARGYDYLSDDMLPLARPSGEVVPLPLPLSIKPGSLDILSARHPELAQAEVYRTKGVDGRLLVPEPGVWATPSLPMRSLVFPRFSAGASAELAEIPTLEALQRLLQERIWLGHPVTEAGVTAFLAWLSATPCFALTYGGVEDSLRLMDRVLR